MKKLIVAYVRINGVEKVAIDRKAINAMNDQPKAKAGLVENREFHEALGLMVGRG